MSNREEALKHDLQVIINDEIKTEQVISYLKTAGLLHNGVHNAIEALEGDLCISSWYSFEDIQGMTEEYFDFDVLDYNKKKHFMRCLNASEYYPGGEHDLIGMIRDTLTQLDYNEVLLPKE